MPAVFIVNPTARGGRASRADGQIQAALDGVGATAEVVRTDAPGHAENLAARAIRDGLSPVVAVGGDGTVHEVVNGLLRDRLLEAGDGDRDTPPPAFGVVPTGSGNDFARTAGLPADIPTAVERILRGPRRRIDAGRSGDRVFLNAASVGFDAEVAAMVDRAGSWLRATGPLLYPLAVLRALPRFSVGGVRLILDGRTIERRALLVAIANGAYYGGGFRICPAADPSDGWLDVCVLGDVTLMQAARLLPRLRAGTHVGAAGVEHFRARQVRVDGTRAPAQLDGEPTGSAPAEFHLLAGALSLCGASLAPAAPE